MLNPIYEPKGRAKEYCDYAVNIYNGCNHGCTYCYAPAILRKPREEFEQVEPRKDIVESVKRQLARGRLLDKTIMLCFTCDPYPAFIDTSATREVIKAIKESGNHVQILTKGGNRALRDFDLLDKNDKFGITLSGDESKELNAAYQAERYDTLKTAHACGIETFVSFEPVFSPTMVYEYIIYSYCIDFYKIGKLNHAPSSINWREFGIECERLCKEHGVNYYIKEDLRAEMGRELPEGLKK